jgi:CRISPR/Cas system-associated exonuclease Cas4 (RecB family)
MDSKELSTIFEEAIEGWNWKACLKPLGKSGKKHRVGRFWGEHLSVSSIAWITASSSKLSTKVCSLGVGSKFPFSPNKSMSFGIRAHNSLMPRVAKVAEKHGVRMKLEEFVSNSFPSVPSIGVRGRVDGITSDAVIELKNRTPNNNQSIKAYEILQASIYAMLVKKPVFLVVMRYGDSGASAEILEVSLHVAQDRVKAATRIIKEYARLAPHTPAPPLEGAECNRCPQSDRCEIPRSTLLCPHCHRPVTVDTLHQIDRGRSMPVGVHYCGYAFLMKPKDDSFIISQIRVSGDRLQRRT